MPQRWLLLTHQLPNEPSNLRVKVWRKLNSLGAVPVKNSIYALPNRSSTREDFEWLRKEILQAGGEAAVFAADSLSEKDDRDILAAFLRARAKDYDALGEEARAFNAKLRAALDGGHIKEALSIRFERQWSDLRRERERIGRIDFFAGPAREEIGTLLEEGQALLGRSRALSVRRAPKPPPAVAVKELRGKTWVTRRSAHVDRLAAAWLVVRFIDPKARFKFVALPYQPRPGELRFDMAEGEFTHFGDWCTFETLARRLRLDNPAVAALAEIVHDIDLKDAKFSRSEAPGVALAIQGLCRRHPKDPARLAAGLELFDALYAALRGEAPR